MSFDRLWLALGVLLPGLVALLVPLPAVDLAYHIRVGADMLSTGGVPQTDTFTFTVAGEPWVDQQWLAQLLLVAGHRLGGWELLVVMRAAAVSITVATMIATARARGMDTRSAVVVSLLGFAVMAPSLALRPQLLAIVLFSILVLLVAVRRARPSLLWTAPVIMLLWSNIHGSFVLGIAVLGYAVLDALVRREAWRNVAAVAVVSLIATCITPFGPDVWRYALSIAASPVIANQVSEWQRTSPLTVTGAIFYASVLAVGIVVGGRRRRLNVADWLLMTAFVVVGAWTVRGVAWWPPIGVLLVSLALGHAEGRLIPRTPRVTARMNIVLVGVVGALMVAALPWWKPVEPLAGRVGLLTYAPVGIASTLDAVASPGARVVAPQVWGSWIEWSVPSVRTFVDSRLELFPPDVWSDHAAISAGGVEAAATLERWAVDVLVLEPDGREPPGWVAIYEDIDGSILVPAGTDLGTFGAS